jgi:N-acetylated-alpha-linked acidic dipeptidase
MRMANADVLPLRLTDFADTVGRYVQQLHKLADDEREHASALANLLDQNEFTLAADPTRVVAPPEREPEVPYMDLTPLDNALVRLKKCSREYDDAYAQLPMSAAAPGAAQRERAERILQGLEQTLMSAQGLPGRPWFQHMIYAPGLYTGYGVKTLPGVREAIEQHRWDEAARYAAIIGTTLANYCDRVDEATAALKSQH